MKLNSHERKALHDAMAAAEKRTSARLAVLTVPVSDRYKLYPLVYGGLSALVAAAVLAIWQPRIDLREAFVVIALVAAAVTFLLDILPLRLMVIPRHAKNWECWELAHRAFASRVLSQNDRKTGILFFVSLGERYVEVVTDRDVDLHIRQSVWDAIIQDFLKEAKAGRVGEALPKAIAASAEVLAEFYPPQ